MFFIGTHFQTVDPKGRIVLPARFKRLLDPADQEHMVLTLGLESCLVLVPPSGWDKFADSLAGLDHNETTRAAIRDISLSTVELELDANGRLTIPREFLLQVGVEREIVVVGALRYIEVWARAAYEKDRELRKQASRSIKDQLL